ncbi:TatA/E family twin arginine-targeting protein translocase [Pseudanabaena mucicola]|uniref:Sec-independent protein translocase protein TatA n=1 Tax=Pseudanabaena mucicola FACHB-723 TaxID=2692860 RepID=A0ABR7ZYC3_9CYAN|nr:TatA/E family twin arginine-targeting protein translocase [Pseudanabaena mucicola]MBD2188824.1 TatA/E family twin arginine-targeting protein translocase [Pseudanabaena mucicola FACHB-723]
MNIFGIGLPEMILIMLVALLIFGPKKLPEIGRSVGKAIKGFQDASREFESEFKREADRIEQTSSEAASIATSPKSDDAEAVVATVVESVPAEVEAKEVANVKDA